MILEDVSWWFPLRSRNHSPLRKTPAFVVHEPFQSPRTGVSIAAPQPNISLPLSCPFPSMSTNQIPPSDTPTWGRDRLAKASIGVESDVLAVADPPPETLT